MGAREEGEKAQQHGGEHFCTSPMKQSVLGEEARRQQGQLGLDQSGKDLKQLLWESDRELKMEIKEDGRGHSKSPKKGTGSGSNYFWCTNPFNRIQQFGIRNR